MSAIISGDSPSITFSDSSTQATGFSASGMVAFFAMQTPPTGWLAANGGAVSRTTYANLFAAIGTTFGAGDGSTTFNLPNMGGQFARGWISGQSVDSGRTFGSSQADLLGSHAHTVSTGFTGVGSTPQTNVCSAGSGAIGFTTDAAGGAETRPKNIALLACIKT